MFSLYNKICWLLFYCIYYILSSWPTFVVVFSHEFGRGEMTLLKLELAACTVLVNRAVPIISASLYP